MSAHDEAEIVSLGRGQSVDTVDQLSSIVLMGLALAGSAVAILALAIL